MESSTAFGPKLESLAREADPLMSLPGCNPPASWVFRVRSTATPFTPSFRRNLSPLTRFETTWHDGLSATSGRGLLNW